MKNVEYKTHRIISLDETSYCCIEYFCDNTLNELYPDIDWSSIWYRTRITRQLWDEHG